MAGINFSGLASGIDTRALIDAILSVERKPIERLQAKETSLTQRQSALDELRSKLSAFETALRDLGSVRTFRSRIATVSDESVLRASAGADAELGLFSVEVQSLAAAHKVRSNGYASASGGLVADGTITIQSGSNDPITIDVSAANGNNTLEAIRDEINAADQGVQASVLFDGTDYLLTVRATESGTANALSITDGTDLGLDAPTNEIVAASDAQLTVDGIPVTSSSNSVSGVIPNVTLDLVGLTSGSPVTVEIGQDDDTVVDAVDKLVEQYNDLVGFLYAQDDRENPGPLAGDTTIQRIQLKVQSLMTGGVEGIPIGGIRSLSAIGVSFDGKTGEASVDKSKLREMLDTHFDEIGDMFLSSVRASDRRIQLFSYDSTTAVGEYAIQVSQAAEQASVVGDADIRPQGLQRDETLTVTLGAQASVVDLFQGQDITAIVDALNAAFATDGVDATAVDDNGFLRITSDAFGSDQSISVTSTLNGGQSGRQTGFSQQPTTDDGLDVIGTIGGEAATGAGRLLTADPGTTAAGLTVRVNATAADVTATGGDFGTVGFSRGLIDDLIDAVDPLTKFGTGTIDVAKEAIEADLKRLADDILRFEDRIAAKELRLIRAFTAAEDAIAALQAQQAGASAFQLFGN